MINRPPRRRLQALAQGRGAQERLAALLAFDAAAQISARPLEEFHRDPTQLANGLSELQRALGSDVICCALADNFEKDSVGSSTFSLEAILVPGTRGAASLEACRRLRATAGESCVLLAGLTGPATLAAQFATDLSTAGEVFTSLAKAFCAAGADLILVFDAALPTDLGQWADTLKTAGNIARFHRALAMQWDSAAPLPQPAKIPLFAPSKGLAGITVTTEIAAPDVSLEHLKAWITAVSAE